jgi:hypothetical protein
VFEVVGQVPAAVAGLAVAVAVAVVVGPAAAAAAVVVVVVVVVVVMEGLLPALPLSFAADLVLLFPGNVLQVIVPDFASVLPAANMTI